MEEYSKVQSLFPSAFSKALKKFFNIGSVLASMLAISSMEGIGGYSKPPPAPPPAARRSTKASGKKIDEDLFVKGIARLNEGQERNQVPVPPPPAAQQEAARQRELDALRQQQQAARQEADRQRQAAETAKRQEQAAQQEVVRQRQAAETAKRQEQAAQQEVARLRQEIAATQQRVTEELRQVREGGEIEIQQYEEAIRERDELIQQWIKTAEEQKEALQRAQEREEKLIEIMQVRNEELKQAQQREKKLWQQLEFQQQFLQRTSAVCPEMIECEDDDETKTDLDEMLEEEIPFSGRRQLRKVSQQTPRKEEMPPSFSAPPELVEGVISRPQISAPPERVDDVEVSTEKKSFPEMLEEIEQEFRRNARDPQSEEEAYRKACEDLKFLEKHSQERKGSKILISVVRGRIDQMHRQ
ncbi:MAG: hypothetical protein LBS71_02360 [Puniceicoccales bacterium]|nr:hypothetical protein [Puniceicoccales bacterium]